MLKRARGRALSLSLCLLLLLEPIKTSGSIGEFSMGIFQAAGPAPRDRKSDTADVTLASRLTGMERCIDGHKHVTVEHLCRHGL